MRWHKRTSFQSINSNLGTEDDLEQRIFGICDTKQKLFVTARSPEREADGGKPSLPYERSD